MVTGFIFGCFSFFGVGFFDLTFGVGFCFFKYFDGFNCFFGFGLVVFVES